MFSFSKPLLVFFSLLLYSAISCAQDSSAIQQWKVSSQKTGENKYDLVFNAVITNDWMVYAPNQLLLDTKTTDLRFNDSAISFPENFNLVSTPQKIQSPIFGTEVEVIKSDLSWTIPIIISGTVPAKLQGTLFYTYGRNDEFYPATTYSFEVDLEGGIKAEARIHISSININAPVADCGDDIKKDSSLFAIFFLGFLGGFIALLTPCVFPMIPLTVSFFTQKNDARKKGVGGAVLYGFFIFLIYVLLTVPFHIAGKTNPEIFNNISTDVGLNLVFFAIFVAFALSFFGVFEIALPSGIANRAGSRSGIGNIAGIFFMAITLAIVSFSCTGPILGTLLAGVAEEGPWPLTAGAAGFGLALGLPFAFFAMFPKWLQTIPKSGGWLTDVKVVLGFIELALAIKFLANADNVKQWGILKREVFVASWVIIGFFIVIYLLGLLRIAHSHKPKRFSGSRVTFIILFGLATIYLIPGLTNTPWARLKMISGFPPPVCYSIYQSPVNCDEPLLDYEFALQRAKAENKPILIDFTGWACVNCRRMEEKVWTKPQVEKLMKNDFILVSLYVDERRKLPSTEQVKFTTKTGIEKSIVTVGDKWTTFQIENFDATSQPQYAIISPDEKALVKTKFYTPNSDEFARWLQCGLDAFEKYKAEKK